MWKRKKIEAPFACFQVFILKEEIHFSGHFALPFPRRPEKEIQHHHLWQAGVRRRTLHKKFFSLFYKRIDRHEKGYFRLSIAMKRNWLCKKLLIHYTYLVYLFPLKRLKQRKVHKVENACTLTHSNILFRDEKFLPTSWGNKMNFRRQF